MHRLSNLDASFLQLESARTPMHIGCILTFSAPLKKGKPEEMSFQHFKDYIESRLPISPIFRRKLATQVLDVDRPAWIEDENFNIDQHVFERTLNTVLAQHQKKELIKHFFSEALDQSRPLWEIMFLTKKTDAKASKSNSEFYVLLKFHHAAVDGMSAEKILSGLLSPEKGTPSKLKDSWTAKHTPRSEALTEITGKHLQNAYRSPNKIFGLVNRLGRSVFNSQSLRMMDKEQLPPRFFMAPETPFNQAIGKEHDFASAHLSLDKVKEIRKFYPGSTINDVVLAICSGALRAHLDKQGKLPEQPLVAMIPVSKREKESSPGSTKKENGNLISPMLVSLATDLDTAQSRLGMIHQNTLRAKEFNHKVAVERIMKHLPSWSSSLTIKAYTRLRMANLLKPVFNMLITNVPGPRVPLYLDGAELQSMEGIAPIVDNMGLTMVVTSYINTLTISLTSCESMADQTQHLVTNFEQALEELYQEVVVENTVRPLIAA